MKYYVFPDAQDDCDLPTQPEPLALDEIGLHLATWLGRYNVQGFYSNCRMQRVPLDRIAFRIVPEDQWL